MVINFICLGLLSLTFLIVARITLDLLRGNEAQAERINRRIRGNPWERLQNVAHGTIETSDEVDGDFTIAKGMVAVEVNGELAWEARGQISEEAVQSVYGR